MGRSGVILTWARPTFQSGSAASAAGPASRSARQANVVRCFMAGPRQRGGGWIGRSFLLPRLLTVRLDSRHRRLGPQGVGVPQLVHGRPDHPVTAGKGLSLFAGQPGERGAVPPSVMEDEDALSGRR